MKVIRSTTLAERAGVYYVRIQAMAVKHHISLYEEFDEHDTPDTKYIVITDDVLPVATCRLYPENAETMVLGRVVVLPEYRRRGLGRQVITEAEDWTKELGYKKTVLEARENKVGFYEKLGYTADNSRIIYGDTFTCVYMEKELE